MAVAWNNLRRDWLRFEAELLRDVFLDARIDVGEGADGAGDRAGRHLLAGGEQASAVARKLGVMSGELQSEGRRLGVNAVAAPYRRRQFVLEGATLQHREQFIEIGQQDVG